MENEITKMSENNADIVIGRSFPINIDSPLFLTNVMDNFFNGLEEAGHSPSKERQRKIEHVLHELSESFGMALERLNLDIEASVSLIQGEIENMGSNNNQKEGN
jgi:hypothetical protein